MEPGPMDRSSGFRELSLDQMVEIGAQVQDGDIVLSGSERFELARMIVRRKEVVAELETLVSISYEPPAPPIV